MCRSHVEGYKRCKGSAATKTQESLRKSVNYQAKKAGLSPQEWKEQNPELLELINKSYDERLIRFEDKINSEESNTVGFVDSTGETLLTGVQTPEAAAKKYTVNKCDFVAKGEKRMGNSLDGMTNYLGQSESYIKNNLKLDKLEKHALLCYTNNLYAPINDYLLRKDPELIFSEHESSWKDSDGSHQSYFKDEEDFTDCTDQLDSALSHRLGEERIVYRGMGIRPSSGIIMKHNGGKQPLTDEDTREIMQKIYTPGAALAFDSYSSASDSIDTAVDWCGADYSTWNFPPTALLFEIKSSAGVPIASVSGHGDEREVLLPRGMNFRVVNSYWNGETEDDCYKFDGTHTKSHRMAKNRNTMIVQLVEVDDNGSEISDHTTKYVTPEMKSTLSKKETIIHHENHDAPETSNEGKKSTIKGILKKLFKPKS